jgi:hypothetical protein
MMTRVERQPLRTAASLLILATALIAQPALSRSTAAQNTTAPSAVPIPQEFADTVEIRIAELHHTLRITPAQDRCSTPTPR